MDKNIVIFISVIVVFSVVLVIIDPIKRSWYLQKIKKVIKP